LPIFPIITFLPLGSGHVLIPKERTAQVLLSFLLGKKLLNLVGIQLLRRDNTRQQTKDCCAQSKFQHNDNSTHAMAPGPLVRIAPGTTCAFFLEVGLAEINGTIVGSGLVLIGQKVAF
jgi:hypothetical protein